MKTLDQLRKKVRSVDTEIVKLLLKREKIVRKIGLLKKELNIKVIDKKQERAIMENYASLSEKYDIEFDYLKRIFTVIIKHAREIQK